MKTFRTLARLAATALIAGSMLAPAPGLAIAGPGNGIFAGQRAAEGPMAREPRMELAQSGGCYGIAQQIAAQHGGTVYSADAASRGGQTVCVIVVVVPARDGRRGRRLELTVPAN